MLRWLAIFTVFAFGISNFAWPQVVGNGGKQEQQSKSNTKCTEIPLCSQVQVSPTNQENNPQPKPYQWRELYAPANMPNWVLAIVAGWAGIMALKTLWAIKQQADIQAAGLKQWVDVQVTTSKCKQRFVRGGVEHLADKIEIWFRAANQTAYPLTIQEVLVKISRARPDGPKWEEYRRKEEITLSPRTDEEVIIGQKNIHDYHFFVPLDLDVGMAAQYNAHTFKVSISGHISFKPVIGQVEKQNFGYSVSCGPDNVRVFPSGSKLEERKDG
jgi:hypothetical protein